MNADEFQAAIDQLGLTQVAAARLFDVADRTARRWASGEQDVPRAVAIALRLMIDHKVKPATVARAVS